MGILGEVVRGHAENHPGGLGVGEVALLPCDFACRASAASTGQRRRSDRLLLAMNVPTRGSEEITPPPSLRGPPLTPPPTDEKEARDTSYILRQIAKHRSGNTGQTIYKVDKRVWNAISPLLLRDDKLQYARSVYLQGQRWCHANVEAQF